MFEEVFLTPPRKHSGRKGAHFPGIIRGQNRGLMPLLIPVAYFPHPHFITHLRAPFGQPHLNFLPVDQPHGLAGKFVHRPRLAGKLVIGHHRHSQRPQAAEELRGVRGPIKDQGEAGQSGIGLELFRRGLAGYFLQEPGHDRVFQHLDQAWIGGLGDDEERLSIHRIDPIVGRAPQTKLLTGDVAPGQIGEASVVNPHMAVDVEGSDRLRFRCHPFLSQLAAPLVDLLGVGGEQRQLAAQGLNFG